MPCGAHDALRALEAALQGLVGRCAASKGGVTCPLIDSQADLSELVLVIEALRNPGESPTNGSAAAAKKPERARRR